MSPFEVLQRDAVVTQAELWLRTPYQHRQHLLGVGGNPTPGTSTGEGVGTATYNNCVALEDWATAEYGDRVIKIREWLMQFNDGSADDLDYVAKGVVPRSLRLDIIHNTTISNGHIARRIAYEINRRSW